MQNHARNLFSGRGYFLYQFEFIFKIFLNCHQSVSIKNSLFSLLSEIEDST